MQRKQMKKEKKNRMKLVTFYFPFFFFFFFLFEAKKMVKYEINKFYRWSIISTPLAFRIRLLQQMPYKIT